ncbi:MAG: hypothetical protein PWQ85_1455 [Geotoga sp.]|jgi:hypothetical protein|nr:hypothetical protein [Geotoga sp.]
MLLIVIKIIACYIKTTLYLEKNLSKTFLKTINRCDELLKIIVQNLSERTLEMR